MSPKLNVGDALGYGFGRTVTRGGAILIAAYAVLQIAVQVSIQSLVATLVAGALPAEQVGQSYPLALELPVAVSAGATALLMLLGTVLAVVATRAVYADIDRVPTADHTRRLLRTVVVTIAVAIITSIAVMIGTVFLIVPGIFLAVSLVFAQPTVVIEDAGVVESLRRSWTLTSGNRLRLFALGLIVAVLSGVAGGAFSLLGIFLPVVGDLAAAVVTAVVSVFGLGVLVGSYRQLADGDGDVRTAESVTTV